MTLEEYSDLIKRNWDVFGKSIPPDMRMVLDGILTLCKSEIKNPYECSFCLFDPLTPSVSYIECHKMLQQFKEALSQNSSNKFSFFSTVIMYQYIVTGELVVRGGDGMRTSIQWGTNHPSRKWVDASLSITLRNKIYRYNS